jgi:hypothetical protein
LLRAVSHEGIIFPNEYVDDDERSLGNVVIVLFYIDYIYTTWSSILPNVRLAFPTMFSEGFRVWLRRLVWRVI